MNKQRLMELAGIQHSLKENIIDPQQAVQQMADIFQRVIEQEESDEEWYHERSSDLMNDLHRELHERGLMI